MACFYDKKVFLSGEIVEIYEYSLPIDYGYKGQSPGAKGMREDWTGKDEKNLRKARTNLRRIIWSNIGKRTKFLTLTYAENVTDYKVFKKDWNRFCVNMRAFGYKLKFLYVLEYQERGAIHAHVVLFNEEYIPVEVIRRAWKKGFVKINRIKDVKNLGAYVCKYLTKNTLAEYNSRSYFVSQGLKRSEEKRYAPEQSEAVKGIKEAIRTIYEAKYILTHEDENGNIVEDGEVRYTQGVKV